MSNPDGAGLTSGGVLAGLDSSTARPFYWYLTLLACIGGFLFGYDTAVIGSVLNFIPYKLSDFATGYLVAGASLGAAVGALAAGPMTDRFGRKSLLIVDAAIYAVGAILSAVTVNVGILLGARTLIGLAVGADSAIATAYIAEFAPSGRRGQLSIIQQWMITVGILVSYLIALLIFWVAPGAAPGPTGGWSWGWAPCPRSSPWCSGRGCPSRRGGCCTSDGSRTPARPSVSSASRSPRTTCGARPRRSPPRRRRRTNPDGPAGRPASSAP